MVSRFLLAMSIKHLTENGDVITIVYRYRHGQSYTKFWELKTTLCSSVLMSASVLLFNISADNNVGFASLI